MLNSTKKKSAAYRSDLDEPADSAVNVASGFMSSASVSSASVSSASVSSGLSRSDRDSHLIEDILDRNLYEPAREICDRPSKNVRSKLVEAGFYLAGREADSKFTPQATTACDRLAEVLEAIHAGSLIVDDIQDGSKERRGQPSLHIQYGLPVALNAGNWLYFQPFDWIRRLDLAPEVELKIYRLCHEAMLKAHMGQAIDVGTRIDEVEARRAREVCMTSLSLKTGSLTSLALAVGAAIGGASEERMNAICEFGSKFGVALQMFDDIGNFGLPNGHPKRLEDFRLRRPTWLWAVAAEASDAVGFARLVLAVNRLPDETALVQWIAERDLLSLARVEAIRHLDGAFSQLTRDLDGLESRGLALSILSALSERIRNSYGTF